MPQACPPGLSFVFVDFICDSLPFFGSLQNTTVDKRGLNRRQSF
jgi:hypothetical protein